MGAATRVVLVRPGALAFALALAAVGCNSDSPSSSDAGGGGPDMDAKVGDAATRDAAIVGPVHDASTDAGKEPAMDAGMFDAATDAQTGPRTDAGDASAHAGDASGPAHDAGSAEDDASTQPIDAGSPQPPTYLCGAAEVAVASETGTSTLLGALGLQSNVTDVWKDGDYVAGSEVRGGWILWNGSTGRQITQGASGRVIGLAGGILAVSEATLDTAGQLTMYSVTDGHMLGSASLDRTYKQGLASDGSYVWTASTTALSVWSAAGSPMATLSGNYAPGFTFAAPGQLRIARGPAGNNVIQTVNTADGTTANSPSFTGTFSAWFSDGSKFLSYIGANVYVYTAAASPVQLVPVTTVGVLGGGGSYFWNYQMGPGHPLDMYEVAGDGQIAKTYSAEGTALPIGSAHRLSFLDWNGAHLTVIDLDSKPLTEVITASPYLHPSAFAADEDGDWVIGTNYGVVYEHGATSASRTGPLGCGQVFGIAGSSSVGAIGTASGGLFLIDPSGHAKHIDLIAGGLEYLTSQTSGIELSSDGLTLAAAATSLQYGTDRSVYIYKGSGWTNTKTFSQVTGGQLLEVGFDMSRDASTLVRTVFVDDVNGNTYQTNVTSLDGTTAIWSSTEPNLVPLLSPDGSHFSVTDKLRAPESSTRLYHSSTLIAALSGSAVGWLDDDHLLIQTYELHSGVTRYLGTNIHAADGTLLSSPPLPELYSFDVVDSSTILSHKDGKMYDVTTGAASAASAVAPQSTVVGPYIFSVTGRTLQALRY